MKTLTNYQKNCNNSPKQIHRNHQAQRLCQRDQFPSRMVFDASIELSRCGDCLWAALAIFQGHRKVDHKLLMLRDCTEERGWLQCYQVIQQMADKHSEGARILIRKEVNKVKMLRRAA